MGYRHIDLDPNRLEHRAMVACHSIKEQLDDTPDTNLWFAVIERAVNDLVHRPGKILTVMERRDAASAVSFLNADHEELTSAGISMDWVRRTLRKFDVPFELTSPVLQH